MDPDLIPGVLIRDDDEGLFSRDIDGQLVRLDSPTASDYDKTVTMQIDGQTVTVPLASPLKDSHGNIVQPAELEKEYSPFNELGRVAERACAIPDRLRLDVFSDPVPPAAPKKGRHTLDASSPVFTVDHTACILCERCIRACDDVQENHVIG